MKWKHSALNYKITLSATTNNNTVNKFTRNHNPYCTFCTLSREPEDKRETPYHLFFACRHTEQISEKFFRRFLGNGYAEMMRTDYFGGFDSINLSLNIVSFLFKLYIWKCKLRFRIPGEEESIDFAKSHITTFFSLYKNFRETWTKSGIIFCF